MVKILIDLKCLLVDYDEGAKVQLVPMWPSHDYYYGCDNLLMISFMFVCVCVIVSTILDIEYLPLFRLRGALDRTLTWQHKI